MSDMKKINDDNLDQVNGGMLFDSFGYEGDPNLRWEVLNNDNCEVIARFSTKDAAAKWVTDNYGTYSYNAQEVDWDTVQRLRKNPNTY
ncbi:MAG: hypothetical protein K5886_04110 [Lachnospiraceae bacterium]|nr:hypothetical protein [Lachnospiraceae bacterium]